MLGSMHDAQAAIATKQIAIVDRRGMGYAKCFIEGIAIGGMLAG